MNEIDKTRIKQRANESHAQRQIQAVAQKEGHSLVLYMIECEKVDEAFFKKSVNHVTIEQFRDIIDERSISSICGYPLCKNQLVNVPSKKYHICKISNKIVDITERKKFCSNYCFRAFGHVEEQIPTSPLWLRKPEELKEIDLCNFRFKEKGMDGIVLLSNPKTALIDEVEQLGVSLNSSCKVSTSSQNKRNVKESNTSRTNDSYSKSNLSIDKDPGKLTNKKCLSQNDNGIDHKTLDVSTNSENVSNSISHENTVTYNDIASHLELEKEESKSNHKSNLMESDLEKKNYYLYSNVSARKAAISANQLKVIESLEEKKKRMKQQIDSINKVRILVDENIDAIGCNSQVSEKYAKDDCSSNEIFSSNDKPLSKTSPETISDKINVSNLQSKVSSSFEFPKDIADKFESVNISEIDESVIEHSSNSFEQASLVIERNIQYESISNRDKLNSCNSNQINEDIFTNSKSDMNEKLSKNNSTSIKKYSVLKNLNKSSDYKKKTRFQKVTKTPLELISETFSSWKTTDTIVFLNSHSKGGYSTNNKTFLDYKISKLAEKWEAKLILEESDTFQDYDTHLRQKLPSYEKISQDSENISLKIQERNEPSFEELVKERKRAKQDIGRDHEPQFPENEQMGPPVIPLIDSCQQMSHRQKIVLDKLNKPILDQLLSLNLRFEDIADDLRLLVFTFDLKSHNIMFNSIIWTTIGFILLKVIGYFNFKVAESFQTDSATLYEETLISTVGFTKNDMKDIFNSIFDIDLEKTSDDLDDLD